MYTYKQKYNVFNLNADVELSLKVLLLPVLNLRVTKETRRSKTGRSGTYEDNFTSALRLKTLYFCLYVYIFWHVYKVCDVTTFVSYDL